MSSSGVQNQKGRNNKKIIFIVSALMIVSVFVISFYVLKKIKDRNDEALKSAPQEQFVGQAESSVQLQAECQKSAVAVIEAEDLIEAFSEYKLKAENCKEVYFSVEEKSAFRNEGMYPDLLIDLIQMAAKNNSNLAYEMLNFGKSLGGWQMYMGPVVCDSVQVLAAYEESLKNSNSQKCFSLAQGQSDLLAQLKLNNFDILDSYITPGQVAWLAAMEAGVGCPEALSSLKRAVRKATEMTTLAGESQAEQQETQKLSLVYQDKSEDDKLVLQFKIIDNCLRFESALVSGLRANE